MVKGEKWIPTREQEFVVLCERWKAELRKSENTTAFGWDPDAVIAVLSGIHVFLSARSVYLENNSTKNRQAKDDTMAAAIRGMRVFANIGIRFNGKMRPEDKAVFNIHEPERGSTGLTEINSFPEAMCDTSIIRQLIINYWDSVTKKRGKPYGIHGAEIRWAILDKPPLSIEELTHADFNTASPYVLKFDETMRGKRVYFCLRWETNANVKGPFGEIYSAIIP